MWYKNVGTTFFSFVTNPRVWQTDRQTDRHTDSFLVARPRCMECMQRGKNHVVWGGERSLPSSPLYPPLVVLKRHCKLLSFFYNNNAYIWATKTYHTATAPWDEFDAGRSMFDGCNFCLCHTILCFERPVH